MYFNKLQIKYYLTCYILYSLLFDVLIIIFYTSTIIYLYFIIQLSFINILWLNYHSIKFQNLLSNIFLIYFIKLLINNHHNFSSLIYLLHYFDLIVILLIFSNFYFVLIIVQITKQNIYIIKFINFSNYLTTNFIITFELILLLSNLHLSYFSYNIPLFLYFTNLIIILLFHFIFF